MGIVVIDGRANWAEDTGTSIIYHEGSEAEARRILDTAVDVQKSGKVKPYNVCVDGRFYFQAIEADVKEEPKPRRGRKKVTK